MALHYRTLGFVIKKNNIGESDRIFTVFSQDFGKIKILGKAIRKITSKLRSGIDLICLSEIEFIQGKTYKTLTDAVILEKFENIKKDLSRLKIAHKISDVVDDLLKGEERDEKIWELLNEVFSKLNDQEFKTKNQQLIYHYFLWNFFAILGYQPEFYKCASCQKKLIADSLYFSAEEGGIICNKCNKKEIYSKWPVNNFGVVLNKTREQNPKVNTDIVKILRIILKSNLSALPRLKIQQVLWGTLEKVSEQYYSYLSSIHFLERDFKRDNKTV